MSRGREWRHAINDKKTSSASSSSSSSSPTSTSNHSNHSNHSSLANSPNSEIDDQQHNNNSLLLFRQYSEEEANLTSTSFLKNVLSNTILYSVQNQDLSNTKMILEHYQDDIDYDLSHHNWRGETALMLAAQKNDVHTLQLLLEHGADIDQMDPDGNTALLHAVKYRAAHATLHLIRFGANYNHLNDEGFNALFYSLEHGSNQVLFFDFFIRCGCDIQVINVYGQSLLMHAIVHQHKHAVEVLLSRGVVKEYCNVQNETAYDIAVKYIQLDLLKQLQLEDDVEETEEEEVEELGEKSAAFATVVAEQDDA